MTLQVVIYGHLRTSNVRQYISSMWEEETVRELRISHRPHTDQDCLLYKCNIIYTGRIFIAQILMSEEYCSAVRFTV